MTTAKKVPGTPFTKGDPRINRKGRPKSFDALRELAQKISHEALDTKEGKRTVAEIILRQMATDPKQRIQFLEYAFGKVPTNLDVTTGGKPLNWKEFINGNPDPGTDSE